MTATLGFDTATPDTVVALVRDGAEPLERRSSPAAGERPGHANELLPLARELMAEAGLEFRQLDRIGVGVGPGTFTGLRIGVATARALAQSSGAALAAISTLDTLATAAVGEADGRAVLAVLDARRGEAFVAAYDAAGARTREPAAVPPQDLAEWAAEGAGAWLAVGDGAVKFAEQLAPAGVLVPADDSPLHRVSAIALCRLARDAEPADRDGLIPEYVRAPDAELRHRP